MLLGSLVLSHFLLFAIPKEHAGYFTLLLIAQCLLWIPFYLRREKFSPLWPAISLLIAFGLARARLPYYENDFYRYFWDGLHVAAGRSPYAYSPATSPLEGFEAIRSQVAYATLPTFYPPAAQLIFGMLVFLSGHSLDIFLLLLAGGGALATGLALRQPLVTTLIILQHPILVREWYSACHYDSWVAAALLAGGYGLAANLKLPTGISFLFVRTWRGRIAFSAAFLLPWLFFWRDLAHPVETMLVFGSHWEMNAGLARWVREGLFAFGVSGDSARAASRITALSVWLIAAWSLWRSRLSDYEKLFWILFSMVALSPVANVWYFTWVLPFVVFLRNPRYVLLAFSVVPLSYAYFIESPFLSFYRWWDLEYLIMAILIFWCYRRRHDQNLPSGATGKSFGLRRCFGAFRY